MSEDHPHHHHHVPASPPHEVVANANVYYDADGQGAPQHNKWSKNGYGNPVQKQSGKFSREESELVRKAVKDYCAAKQISTARLCSECDHKGSFVRSFVCYRCFCICLLFLHSHFCFVFAK